MKININNKHQTRDGGEARIYATDGGGQFPVHGAFKVAGVWHSCAWDKDGIYPETDRAMDLIPLVRKDALGQELPEDMPDLPKGEWVWVKAVEGLRTIKKGHKFESDWAAYMLFGDWFHNKHAIQAVGGADYYIQKLHRPDGTRIDEPIVPEKQYWSKPSDFPPVCWVYLSQHEKKCLPVTAIDMELERFHCHGRKTPLSDISRVRWRPEPFNSWEDGEECLCK